MSTRLLLTHHRRQQGKDRGLSQGCLTVRNLLFSVTNAAELSGPQGRSAEAVRAFLDVDEPSSSRRITFREMIKTKSVPGSFSRQCCT